MLQRCARICHCKACKIGCSYGRRSPARRYGRLTHMDAHCSRDRCSLACSHFRSTPTPGAPLIASFAMSGFVTIWVRSRSQSRSNSRAYCNRLEQWEQSSFCPYLCGETGRVAHPIAIIRNPGVPRPSSAWAGILTEAIAACLPARACLWARCAETS